MHTILFFDRGNLFLQILDLLVGLLGGLFENSGKIGHLAVHLLLQLGDSFSLRSLSLTLQISHSFFLLLFSPNMAVERLLFRAKFCDSLVKLVDIPLKLLLPHLRFHLIKDVFLQLSLLSLRRI